MSNDHVYPIFQPLLDAIAPKPRFENVSCSQCGKDFGPGDHGYSSCESHGARKIITNNVFPPIPLRQFDWVAYFDGDEESGPRGWGRTEAEAITDLKENVE